MAKHPTPPRRTHTKHLVMCLIGLAWGVGLTIAFVPLYYLFCQHFSVPTATIATGPSNLAQTAAEKALPSRQVTVRFMANNSGDMPVTFHPVAYTLKVQTGQPVLTAYKAKNQSDTPIEGVAVHMVYGDGAANENVDDYIDLRQCFCFAEEHYPANAEVTLPLSFSVLKTLPEDVHTITFAYTLFPAQKGHIPGAAQ